MKYTYLEYIWLDGNYPQQLRSKTKIINKDFSKFCIPQIKSSLIEKMEHPLVAEWSFDGSSTGQADTKNSELILKPANIFKDPFRKDSLLVLCEVYTVNGNPHTTNTRFKLRESLKNDDSVNLGFEQEYFIYDVETNRPLGWPKKGLPRPQGDFYCGAGGGNVVGREFIEDHVTLCSKSNILISGINFEVSLAQAEWQVGPVPALDGSDQLWIARYIMFRLSEEYGYRIELDPKPFIGNEINGSGMHINFSTGEMRMDLKNKKKLVLDACQKLEKNIDRHISVYGKNNEKRLTGQNETCSINEFRYGIGDRTASIRIPNSINDDKTPGYLEDRRPASNVDPYEGVSVLIDTICTPKSVGKMKVNGKKQVPTKRTVKKKEEAVS